MKRKLLIFLGFLPFFILWTNKVSAGGWPIYTWSWDNSDAWKPDYKLTYVRAHIAPQIPCKGTTVTFKYEDSEPGDNVSAGGDNGSYTFSEDIYKTSKFNGQRILDCNTYAKFSSTNNTAKIGIVEFKTQDGKVYSGKFALNFHLSSPGNTDSNEKYPLPWEEDYTKKTPSPTNIVRMSAPEMVYPQNGQTIDLEGAYMFKVRPVDGATGYLFRLFQNGDMVYENYRDTKTLSSNGEFALWENDPAHAKFHAGQIKVMIRVYVENQWTDAREIYVTLKPREKGVDVPVVTSGQSVSASSPPEIQPQVVMITNSSESAALQQKINELQDKLQAAEQRQSVLETRLNQIASWIKSIFPFFK